MPAMKHTYRRTHQLSGAALSFSLGAEDAALRQKASAAKAGRAAKTLVKEGPIRVTVVALNKGVALQAHQVEGAVSIHVLRGRARVAAAGGETDLSSGGLVVLQEQVTHAAVAVTDCTLLITVAMPETAPA
jgi:quercetin dioxygenase-like cupin family protein